MLWSVDKALGDEMCENMLEKLFWTAVIKCDVSAIVETWRNNLLEVKEYIIKYNKSPSTHDKIKEVKKLKQWLSRQNTNYKKNIKSMKTNPEIRLEWEKFINDEQFRQYVTFDLVDDWKNHLLKVKEYILKHKKTPSNKSTDKEVKKLGQWLSDQKKNYKKNIQITKPNPEIRLEWEQFINDELFKPYICSTEEEWRNNLVKVKEYIIKYNKSPSAMDKDKEVNKLGSWLSRQKTNHKKNIHSMKTNPEIRLEWEQFINDELFKPYICSTEEEWRNNLVKVKEYIIKYNKSPSHRSTDKEVKKLGSWLSNQKNKYKNNTENMKTNPEIRLEWEQFINDARYNKPTINPTINTPYTLGYDNSDEFEDVVVLTKTKAK